MRVLVDTNVVVSALLFPQSVPAQALEHAAEHAELVLTPWVLDELREVISRKAPQAGGCLETWLAKTRFELLVGALPGPVMRDADDQPILDVALAGAVDVIVTGDKDFLVLTLEQPLIVTPREYLDRFADPRY